MASLLGLVNYSDDEESSSGEEQVTTIKQKSPTLTKTGSTTPKPDPPHPKERARTATPEPKTTSTIAPAVIIKNDYNRRLLAALAAKPIPNVHNWGIPDEPTTECDPERAERIAHFLSLRASGHRLNEHLQHNKAFRNPRIYAKLVEFTDVDEIGSNYNIEEFNPHGFSPDFYLDGILETQKRLAEEKVAANHNRNSLQFVSQSAELSQNQSTAMAQAMAAAAKVANRIAKPPSLSYESDKRKNKWDDHYHASDSKRR
ncbi:HCNGP-like protein-domain-containing protein [Pilobolus umbonatus]|nr:HCNGP-like protein-domain-containing protein [Pilobolus umbonatus]